jgi:hypothetical protein
MVVMRIQILLLILSFSFSLSENKGYLRLTVMNDTSEVPYQGTIYNETGNSRDQCSLLNERDPHHSPPVNCTTNTILDFCSTFYFGNVTYSVNIQQINESMDSMDSSVAMGTDDSYIDENDGNSFLYTCTGLHDKIQFIRKKLNKFESLLTRTLVHVYSESCQDKTDCLKAYTNWLCATQLKLYNSTGNLIKPCYTVCREVFNRCPYYLPLNIIPERQNSTNGTTITTYTKYVYGGYSAFACPIPSDNCTIEMKSSYAQNNCLGVELRLLQRTP